MTNKSHYTKETQKLRETVKKKELKKRTGSKNKSKKRRKKSTARLRKRKQKKLIRVCTEISCSFLITCSIIWVLSIFLFTFHKVEGYGMLSTLSENDLVYIKRKGTITRFKLVYFYTTADHHEKAIQRVIGLPGESVSYKEDQLYINNKEIEESFIDPDELKKARSIERSFTENFNTENIENGKQTIPKDHYLILGDNRPYSTDSRYYGFIPKKNIIGVADMRILPIHLIEKLK